MRIGFGYDVHQFSPERELILCGVQIPYEKGLDGHSDADVATHALMDALLGAGALGDIGMHFPDSDPCYKGISSIILLGEVARLLKHNRYEVVNIDLTIVAQTPKLSGYFQSMRSRLSDCLAIPLERISVKATTEEGLGFTGEGLGMKAYAVCLIA
jgi:2-C-methyl-D-erythritol 2,4-cyclodiphosphate synthase